MIRRLYYINNVCKCYSLADYNKIEHSDQNLFKKDI